MYRGTRGERRRSRESFTTDVWRGTHVRLFDALIRPIGCTVASRIPISGSGRRPERGILSRRSRSRSWSRSRFPRSKARCCIYLYTDEEEPIESVHWPTIIHTYIYIYTPYILLNGYPGFPVYIFCIAPSVDGYFETRISLPLPLLFSLEHHPLWWCRRCIQEGRNWSRRFLGVTVTFGLKGGRGNASSYL